MIYSTSFEQYVRTKFANAFACGLASKISNFWAIELVSNITVK